MFKSGGKVCPAHYYLAPAAPKSQHLTTLNESRNKNGLLTVLIAPSFLQRSLPKSLMLSILLTLLLSMLLLLVFLLAFSSSSIKSSRFFSLFVLTGVLTLGTSPSWFWLVRIANALVKHETSPLSPDTFRTNLPNQIFFVFFCL